METQLIHFLDFISADSTTAVVVNVLSSFKVLTLNTFRFNSAGIRTGRAFLTGVSISARLSALTNPTIAVTPAAAQQVVAGCAGDCDCGAVAVFS